MKIIIFGSNGMLGEYVKSILGKYYDIIPLTRKDFDLININELYKFLGRIKISKKDVFVNCTVIRRDRIKQKGMRETIIVNSLVPHYLADYSTSIDGELIHISSDCVYSGKSGNYSENDPHDPIDTDGRTKSLGEPENATVIRTSIIGEELREKRSLLEWVKSQQGTINGYADYYWNGVTCLQLAKVIKEIIDKKTFWKGVRHIFSPLTVTKFELVSMINKVYKLDLTIKKYNAGFCNRSLFTIQNMNIKIPQLEDQITELKNYKIINP